MNKRLVAIDGPLKGLILDLEDKDSYIIGRDQDQVDLVLKDLTVSRRHVFLQKDGDVVFIENLSKTNPITINEQVLTDKEILHENDEIKIGENIFVYLYKKNDNINDNIEEKDNLFNTIFDEAEKEEIEPEPIKPKKQDVATYYDTIFEDSEDSLSFNLIDENQFILKVISGPNTGAEFGMDKNKQYVLGKDTRSCDIVFNDLSVSKKHAKITIDGNGNVTIEDLKSKNKTFVNNESVKTSFLIKSSDLVTIGTTVFLVVRADEDLHTIYAEIPETKKKEVKEVKEKEEIKEPTAKKNQKEEKQSEWKDIIIPTNHLLIGGSFILIAFVIFLSFFSLFKGKHIEVNKPNITSNVRHVLKKYDSIEYNFNEYNENLFLAGHILTELDHEELIYSLKQLASINKINDNIIVDELIWKNVNNILNDNESYKGINIYATSPGKFIMQGYVQNIKQNEDLIEYININFPYADKLENKVVIEQILQLQVEKIIIINKFKGLKFQLNNGDLILTGQYNKEQEKEFEKMTEQMKKLNGIKMVTNLASPGNAVSNKVDISDKYAVSGFAAFDDSNVSVVINGHIVSVGSLVDEMKVIDIQSHIVLLEKDGLGYKINYNY